MNAVDDIVGRVRAVIGDGPRDLQKPLDNFNGLNAHFFDDPLGHRSIDILEAELMVITEAKHAIAVASGTAALHLALMAAGVGPGDEVLVPTLTFAASAFAIRHCGATPHFIDTRFLDLGIAPFKLGKYLGSLTRQARARIKVIMPVHLLGIPCEVESIIDTAAYYGIPVIEDAAEALGSLTITGKHCGTAGLAGVLSFNCNKIVSTGGGGAVITNDDFIANRVRHLSTNAKVAHPFLWEHDEVGWNYRMPNVCAALGLGQLRRLHKRLQEKRSLAAKYYSAFEESPVALPVFNGTGNDWLNAILLNPSCEDQRDDVIRALQAEGFQARALFSPLHTLPVFTACPRQTSLLAAESTFRRAVCLPSTP